MGILPGELSGAQDLLVKLVQILTPFIENADLKDPKGIASFSQRLFVPPRHVEQEPRLPSRVRLLTTLENAKEEVARWIETLSIDEPAAPAKKADEPKPQDNSSQNLKPEKPPIERASRTPPRPLPELAQTKRNEIQGQAKDLVVQVRRAIQTLASSLMIEEPKLNAFRDCVKRLKPMIEEMIVAVGKSEMANSGDGSQSPKDKTRNAVPIPARAQQLFKSETPLPFREKREAPANPEKRAPRDVRVEKRDERPAMRSFSRVPDERGGERAQPSAPREKESVQPAKEELKRAPSLKPEPPAKREAEPVRREIHEPKATRHEMPRPAAPVEKQVEESSTFKQAHEPASRTPQPTPRVLPEEAKKDLSSPVELRPTPLAAPFTPPIVPSATSKKGKKKPRNFWLKDADDEEENEKERD